MKEADQEKLYPFLVRLTAKRKEYLRTKAYEDRCNQIDIVNRLIDQAIKRGK